MNGISKKVRKQIFASRTWKPRSIQHTEKKQTLLTVKPSVQIKCLNFVCLNIRSLKNKTTSLFDFIVSQNIDVLALTETWWCCGDTAALNELFPPPQAMIFDMLIGQRRGGVALIYKISFRNIVPTNNITQCELLDCIIKVNKLSTKLVVVYKPRHQVKMY